MRAICVNNLYVGLIVDAIYEIVGEDRFHYKVIGHGQNGGFGFDKTRFKIIADEENPDNPYHKCNVCLTTDTSAKKTLTCGCNVYVCCDCKDALMCAMCRPKMFE